MLIARISSGRVTASGAVQIKKVEVRRWIPLDLTLSSAPHCNFALTRHHFERRGLHLLRNILPPR
jgi:hypothetical protein